ILLNYSLIWMALAAATLILAAYKFSADFKLNAGLLVIVSLFLLLGVVGQSLPAILPVPFESRPSLAVTWSVAKGSLSGLSAVFGSGPATFGYDYAFYRPAELNQTNFWPIRFNQGFGFLTTALSTVGVLGFLAVLFLIFAFLRQSRTEERISRNQAGLAKQAVSLGVIFLFINWLLAPIFFTQSVFIFLGLGLIAALSGSVKEIFLRNFSRRQSFISFFVLIVLITASLASVFYLAGKHAAAVYYEKGFAAYNAGDLNKALVNIDKAVKFDSRHDQYLRTLSQFLLLRIDNLARQVSGDLPPEIQTEIQNTAFLAIESGRRATVVNPVDSLNWSNLGGVYEKIIPLAAGADAFAEENYKKAMELDPKNPQEPVNAARSFVVSADLIGSKNTSLWREKLNKAKDYLGKSIALKADYAPAHFLSASIYLREGKTKEAIEKLELAKAAAPFDSGLAFQLGLVYYQNGQPNKARFEFERAIGIDPNYSNSRYFLGLIYDDLENKQAALAQFEKIAELNPDNQEIKKIVENLKTGRPALEGIVPPDQPPAERLETPLSETKNNE
ncbi:MAG: tetratricopeptide repeat protein, partial [Patescibacteria group bacterium]